MDLNKIYLGDNLELLKQLSDESIDSCVSDFPYNLGFMGKKWDTIDNYYQWCNDRAKELFRTMKKGSYVVIFGGTRTYHRMVCAFEDAGFIIKDEISSYTDENDYIDQFINSLSQEQQNALLRILDNQNVKGVFNWMYGSGFPKNYNISKGFDKKAKKESSTPLTDQAKQWDGWGTSLKPAHEPILIAQKPIEKNYCNNIEKYGVGGLNIDKSRIEFDMSDTNPATNPLYRVQNGYKIMSGNDNDGSSFKIKPEPMPMNVKEEGRFPTNVIFTNNTEKIADEQCHTKPSRFFYCPKTTKKDKTENNKVENKHPTVKPTELIKYLIKLVTPPNGKCIDICEGSGTHVKACIELTKEGYPINYIGFENDENSYKIACERKNININR